ncbi:MAG: glycosyltransferase [Candidatus Riflebacteria bacterium]|nr:glycosyltransferase [Candidatus Riflebacteria bacterium]
MPEREKIRVLRLLSRMNVGGPSLHVAYLSAGLKDFGFETLLAVGNPSKIEGSMIEKATELGINPVIVPYLDRRINLKMDLRAFFNILSIMRKFRPHIVHTHTAKAGILGRIAAVILGVPLVFHTFHGHVFEGYFSKSVSMFVLGIERILARLTNRLITLSEGLKKDLVSRLRLKNKEKIRVVKLGLDLKRFAEIPRGQGEWRSTLGFSPDCILLGIVARLVPVKNHLLLLDVFKILSDKDERLRLVIIGGGPQEVLIRRKMSQLGLENKVLMTGIELGIEKVYSDLDLLLLVSRNEGTPVVILEALAAGCPVASTKVGGVGEIMKDTGIFLNGNIEEMACKITEIIEKLPEIEKKVASKRLEVESNFSVKKLVKNTADLYFEVLSGKKIV